ncbi:hypothetical protein GS432_23550 [Rhodococcus hoagii]|nr:hypothetical protein [Prescottella equi]
MSDSTTFATRSGRCEAKASAVTDPSELPITLTGSGSSATRSARAST